MRKFLSLVLALVMVLSIAVVGTVSAGAGETGKTTVKFFDISGNVVQTETYSVGETFTCTVYLNTSALGDVGSLKANQTYDSSKLDLADEYNPNNFGMIVDLEAMFPVTKGSTVANGMLDGEISYNASNPNLNVAFPFTTDDSILIRSHYTVTAAGTAEIHNSITTLAIADYYLTRAINKGVIQNNNFTMNYTLSEPAASGYTVSGIVTSYLAKGNVKVQLLQDEAVVDETTIANSFAEAPFNDAFEFSNVAQGSYTLRFSKTNHVTRDIAFTVDGDTVQDAKIHPIGDFNGDAQVTTADVLRANSHAKGKKILTDPYQFACLDVVGTDKQVSTADVLRLNSHAKGKKRLW